jgi:hypothetical protein
VQSLKSAREALHKESRLKNETIFLIYHMAMQSRKLIPINFGGQFVTLWAYVAIIKYCCVDEIHNVMKVNPKPNSISLASLSFHILSFCSPRVQLLCLFMNVGGDFYCFYLGYPSMKQGRLFCFVKLRSPKSQHFMLHSWYLWRAPHE